MHFRNRFSPDEHWDVPDPDNKRFVDGVEFVRAISLSSYRKTYHWIRKDALEPFTANPFSND